MGIIAGGDYALRNAIEGAEDDETFVLKLMLRDLDLVKEDEYGISARTDSYVAAGLAYANTAGCLHQ